MCWEEPGKLPKTLLLILPPQLLYYTFKRGIRRSLYASLLRWFAKCCGNLIGMEEGLSNWYLRYKYWHLKVCSVYSHDKQLELGITCLSFVQNTLISRVFFSVQPNYEVINTKRIIGELQHVWKLPCVFYILPRVCSFMKVKQRKKSGKYHGEFLFSPDNLPKFLICKPFFCGKLWEIRRECTSSSSKSQKASK